MRLGPKAIAGLGVPAALRGLATRNKGVGYQARLGTDLLAYWEADRSDKVVQSGGAVSAWNDLIGNYAFAQLTGAAKLVYSAASFNGRPGLSADGLEQFMSMEGMPFSVAEGCEVWILMDQQADPGDAVVRIPFAMGGTTSSTRLAVIRAIAGGNKLQVAAGTGSGQITNTNTTKDFTGPGVVRGIFGPTGVAAELDGVSGTETAGTLAPGSTRVRLAAGTAGTAANFAKAIFAAILITKPLVGDKAAKATWLRNKLSARAYVPGPAITDDDQLWVSVNDTTKTVHFASKYDDTQMIRITVAAVTFNDLPTVQSVAFAPLGNPASASWSPAFTQTGDWFGPMVVAANAGGDGSTSGNFTGGNHGSNGDATGNKTAVLNDWAVTVDGVPLTGTAAAFGEVAELIWDLDLQGYNTVSLGRYIANQQWTVRASPCVLEVAEPVVTRLEPLTVYTDYGLQMSTTNYQDALHFWGGQGSAKLTGWTGVGHNSGASDTYPTDSVVAVSGPYGVQASWIDQSFGLGDGSAIGAANPRMLQATTNKVYQGIIREPTVFDAVESYTWRGGYCWAPAAMAGATLEAAMRRTVDGATEYIGMFPAAGSGAIHARSNDNGKVVDVDGVPGTVTAGDITVSSGAYGMVRAQVTG